MFDPRISLPRNHDQILDPFTTLIDSCDSSEPLNFDAKHEKRTQDYEKDQGLQMRPNGHMEDESGSSSPPLWKTSPSRNLLYTRHQHATYRPLSPSSRAQDIIARGQMELMEMVKNMPETCYELSMKDLVEHPTVAAQEECKIEEKNKEEEQADDQTMKVKRQTSVQAKMVRSGSIENRGFFLKMVFPIDITFRSKKKKLTRTTSAKVSPKPEAALDKLCKGVDKDWWRRRFSVASETDSGAGDTTISSSGSRSSSRQSNRNRKREGFLTSRCSCFRPRTNRE